MIIQFPNILSLLGVIEQSDSISLTVHKRARKAIKSWKRDTLRRTLERCVTVLRKLTTLTLLFILLFNESQVMGQDTFCSSTEWATCAAYAPPYWREKVLLVPTPEGAEIRYAVLPVHINMLIFRSSQLDGEINAG